jgi:hypothetical protein
LDILSAIAFETCKGGHQKHKINAVLDLNTAFFLANVRVWRFADWDTEEICGFAIAE